MCHWNYYIFPPPGPWGSTVTRNLIGLPSQCLQSKPQNIRYDSHEDKVAQHVEMITLVLTKKKVFKRDHLIPSSYSFLFWLLLIFLNFYLFVVSSTMCTSVSTHVTAPPYPPSAFVSPPQKQTTNKHRKSKSKNKQTISHIGSCGVSHNIYFCPNSFTCECLL